MAEVVGGMTGALQGTLTGLVNKGQDWLDWILPPEKRGEIWAKLSKFATEKPLIASFILSQIALTGLPLGLFIIMTITVVVFSLLGALLLGLLGALVFIVITVGFALLILLPTIFITTFAAAFIWLWGVGAYYIIKWFNQKEIPGIHTSWKEGLSGLTDGLSGGLLGSGDGGGGGGEKEAYTNKEEAANGKPSNKAQQADRGEEEEDDDDDDGESKEKKSDVQKRKKKKKGRKSDDDGEGKDDGPVDSDVVNDKVPQDKVKDVGKKAGVDTENLDPKEAVDVGKEVGNKTGDVKKATEGVTGKLL